MKYTENQQKFIDLNFELEKCNHEMHSPTNSYKPKDDPWLKLYNKTYGSMNNIVYKIYYEDNKLKELRTLFNYPNDWVAFHAVDRVWYIYDDALLPEVKKFEQSENKTISLHASFANSETIQTHRVQFFKVYTKWLDKNKK